MRGFIIAAPSTRKSRIPSSLQSARYFCFWRSEGECLHCIRHPFCILKKPGCFPVHRGWENQPHGTLEKLFATPFLNGDLNLIGKEGEKFVVYGIPWCGTSKIFTTEKKELGGIVLLEKAPSEELVSLTEEQKTLRVMQRMISPPWTAELMVKNLKFAEAVAKEKPVYFLRCTKNDTAAETIRRQIEEDES